MISGPTEGIQLLGPWSSSERANHSSAPEPVCLSGDFEGTLADKVVADAVVDGKSLHVERSVAEVFQGVSGR
jgi:hypothetical protein